MLKARDLRCEQCAYGDEVSTKDNPIWCSMYRDYFDKSDHCTDFTKKKARNKLRTLFINPFFN